MFPLFSDPMPKYPVGPGINTLTTEEIISELLNRIEKTNGMEFVAANKVYKLWRYLQPYVIDINHRKGKKNVHP